MTKPTSYFHKGFLADYHLNHEPQNYRADKPIEVFVGKEETTIFVGHLRLDIWPAEGYLGEALGKLKGKLKGTSRTSEGAG